MMNKEQTNQPLCEHTKIHSVSDERLNSMSQEAKYLYSIIFDYCTYASDPQYKVLHAFRKQINKLKPHDRDIMIEYFNSDPAINWSGISSKPWDYYEKPY